MKQTLATVSALLLATSMAAAAIPPSGAETAVRAEAPAQTQVAFANSCNDSWWKFSLIEAITCLLK